MNQWPIEEDDDTGPSKSSVKRDMHELQQLAEQLAASKPALWQQLDLGNNLLKALADTQKIKAHEARRRHMQYLGKLIRGEDHQQIRDLLHSQSSDSLAHQQQIAEVEHWRLRLLVDNSGLSEFIDQHPCKDVQQLRQLIKSVPLVDQQPVISSPESKKLFKFLKSIIA